MIFFYNSTGFTLGKKKKREYFECRTCLLVGKQKTSQCLTAGDFELELEQSLLFHLSIRNRMNPQPEKACITNGSKLDTWGFARRDKSQKHLPVGGEGKFPKWERWHTRTERLRRADGMKGIDTDIRIKLQCKCWGCLFLAPFLASKHIYLLV